MAMSENNLIIIFLFFLWYFFSVSFRCFPFLFLQQACLLSFKFGSRLTSRYSLDPAFPIHAACAVVVLLFFHWQHSIYLVALDLANVLFICALLCRCMSRCSHFFRLNLLLIFHVRFWVCNGAGWMCIYVAVVVIVAIISLFLSPEFVLPPLPSTLWYTDTDVLFRWNDVRIYAAILFHSSSSPLSFCAYRCAWCHI